MPKRIVTIEWDNPDEYNWLNPFNIETALSAYCKNTKFKVTDFKETEHEEKKEKQKKSKANKSAAKAIEEGETPKKKRLRIIENKIKCNHCGDIIESIHRHHFATCKCGRVHCDGGQDYLKRSFILPSDYEELSKTIEEE